MALSWGDDRILTLNNLKLKVTVELHWCLPNKFLTLFWGRGELCLLPTLHLIN